MPNAQPYSLNGDPPPAPGGTRKEERTPVNIAADLRRRGDRAVKVQLLDLSTKGFRIDSHLVMSDGVEVWIKLPALESLRAYVAWSRGSVIGFAFEQPLHPAVLRMVVAMQNRTGAGW